MTFKIGLGAPDQIRYGEHLIQRIYAGSNVIWGDDPSFNGSIILNHGTFTLAGQDLQVALSRGVTLNHGEFDLTGFDLVEPTVPLADTVRVTQVDLEVLMTRPSSFEMTQIYNEVLMKRQSSIQMTQCYVEVLMEE